VRPSPSSPIVDRQVVEGNKNLPQRPQAPSREPTMWHSGNTPLPQLYDRNAILPTGPRFAEK
jgi:hypothetical protein